MKKILIYTPGIDYGGIESFLQNIVDGLKYDKDLKVTILTRNGVGSSLIYKRLRELGIVNSIGIEHLNIWNMRLFRRELKKYFACNNFDILHVQDSNEPFVIEEAKKKNGIRVALHFHSTHLIEGKNNILMIFLKNISRRINIRLADVFMAPSSEVVEVVKPFIRGKDIVQIPNAINTRRYAFNEKKRKELRLKYCVGEDFVIGHVGRFAYGKNQEFIIEIFKRYISQGKPFEDSRLILVGEGPKESRIKELVRNYGIVEKVIFVNNNGDIPSLLSMMDIFVFPSLFEGLGISLVEAQCNGLPCLVSNNIPDDAIVTDLVTKISLDDQEGKWIKGLLEKRNFGDRERYAEIVAQNGYGMESFNRMMKEFYLGL